MYNQNSEIIIFFFATTFLILVLAGFIISILSVYQKKYIAYTKNIEEIRLNHEKHLLKSELEIQEQTFQQISREIHDNIGLSLTLAKLQLNIISEKENCEKEKLSYAISLISKAIKDLSDLSKSLNSDFIEKNGFLKALEAEIETLRSLDAYKIKFDLIGSPVFMEQKKEVLLFRIVQEAFNNILKHSHSKNIFIHMTYNNSHMQLSIQDNGVGFDIDCLNGGRSGLNNIQQRIKMLNGTCTIHSAANKGTSVNLSIPFNI